VSGRFPGVAARLAGVSAVVFAAVSAASAAPPGREAADLQAKTHSALLDLYALDSSLQQAQARLQSLQSQAAQLRKQQLELSQQLSATRITLQASQQRLAANLRTLYEQGGVDPLAVVLGAQSLDEALTKLDDLTRVADQSHDVVRVTSAAQTKLTRLRGTLVSRRTKLDDAVASARRTADDLAAAHAARVAFIDRLRLKARQLAALQAAARRVVAKSEQIQAAASTLPPNPATVDVAQTTAAPAAPAAAAASSGKTIMVSSTGYSLSGRTATGMPAGWGVVAVDPSLIPLGTRLTIPGYGEAVAADTGGAVRGSAIDLWFPTHAQALAWGRRTVTITLH
jgi:3D (Asp-Asp-Asp) domain-containing protein